MTPTHRLRQGAIALAILAVAIQLVPYGRTHAEYPVVQEPQWDAPQTRVLAVRACFDCHSNQTTWPWYSQVAPVSWMLARHGKEGGGGVENEQQWCATTKAR